MHLRPRKGWRRLGLALGAVWLLGLGSLATWEWASQKSGIFVYRYIAPGTTLDVSTNEATMPDGRKIRLQQSLMILKPWQIDWNAEPAVATALTLDWQRLLKLGLALPLVLWVLLEVAVAAIAWVARGFRRNNVI